MIHWRIFHRLIVRPMRSEPLRALLTLVSVALGVSVVVAIELSSDAAAGSFRSSMETLAGRAQLEITATGGIEEHWLGKLATLPYPMKLTPRIEGFATMESTEATVPLIGLDLVAQAMSRQQTTASGGVWASSATRLRRGESVKLTVNDQSREYAIAGLVDGEDGFLIMDIGEAQEALGKRGRLDRIEVELPPEASMERYQAMLSKLMPEGVLVEPHGSATVENRKMLAAFRWNLRVLSYISLVVGAFLIYNTISVSVVRRRAEIGVFRALGGARRQVIAMFLGEAALFGSLGSLLGLVLGRWMAEGAVGLLSATVQSLYVSSRPGDMQITAASAAGAFAAGLGVSLAAALAPALEAARVAPVEAMARGRREYASRIHASRDLLWGGAAAVAAWLAAGMEPWSGKPVGGYAACFLLILASGLITPAVITSVSRLLTRLATRLLGVEGLLASRSVAASLSRTSVLVGALSTAAAMMVSVGLLVGSFRETVALWMDNQLQADYYVRPAAGGSAGRYPTMAAEVADRIEALPEVRAVDRFRVYEIRYGGLPALLGGGQAEVIEQSGRISFLPGHDRMSILRRLRQGDYAIVSEPFANKHGVGGGDRIKVPMGASKVSLEVLGVYHDYSNERGYVIVDRSTLLKYLPDPKPSNLAVYMASGQDGLRAIQQAVAGRDVVIFSNRNLREAALRIFDRTFAITWVLEVIAIVVAVLGVSGALLAMVIDRRREIALLRFLGAAAGQIRRMILCEAGLLGLLANAIGMALGSALSLVLIYVINKQSFGWTIQFHWPVALLISALSLIYSATVLAGLYPARMAVRLNPIEVIHEE